MGDPFRKTQGSSFSRDGGRKGISGSQGAVTAQRPAWSTENVQRMTQVCWGTWLTLGTRRSLMWTLGTRSSLMWPVFSVMVFSVVNHKCSRCGRVPQGLRKEVDIRNALLGRGTQRQRWLALESLNYQPCGGVHRNTDRDAQYYAFHYKIRKKLKSEQQQQEEIQRRKKTKKKSRTNERVHKKAKLGFLKIWMKEANLQQSLITVKNSRNEKSMSLEKSREWKNIEGKSMDKSKLM